MQRKWYFSRAFENKRHHFAFRPKIKDNINNALHLFFSKVIGGITFNPVWDSHFAEIAFCAIVGYEQVVLVTKQMLRLKKVMIL